MRYFSTSRKKPPLRHAPLPQKAKDRRFPGQGASARLTDRRTFHLLSEFFKIFVSFCNLLDKLIQKYNSSPRFRNIIPSCAIRSFRQWILCKSTCWFSAHSISLPNVCKFLQIFATYPISLYKSTRILKRLENVFPSA